MALSYECMYIRLSVQHVTSKKTSFNFRPKLFSSFSRPSVMILRLGQSGQSSNINSHTVSRQASSPPSKYEQYLHSGKNTQWVKQQSYGPSQD